MGIQYDVRDYIKKRNAAIVAIMALDKTQLPSTAKRGFGSYAVFT